jgi:hypothetical protein
MNKKLVSMVVIVVMSAVLSACGASGSGKPQPVCRTDGSEKTGYWVALPDSVTENNKYGVCKNTKTGDLTNGEKSFAQYFQAATKAVEGVKTCYDNTGMGSSCLAAEIKK